MIQFQISAPASLSIFGEHANNSLRASIDLRTRLNFQELWLSNNIEINFPEINLFHKIPLQEFLEFYDNCVKNMELFHTQMSLFTCLHTSDNTNQKTLLKIFYYLLVYIMYEEQIEIKTFRIDLSTELMIHEKFSCLASLKVCLAACLLHWTRLRRDIQNTFNDIDLEKIRTYATRCEDTVSELDIIDIMVCTYGSMVQYEMKWNIIESYRKLYLPRMKILLVDSKQTQDVEARNKQMTKLKSMLPDVTNSILNNINVVTNMVTDIFQKILDIFNDNEISTEMKYDCFLQQYKVLETYTRLNQRLLRMLVSYYHLNEICAMAQKHGLSGKYTDLDNGRYVYIWCPNTIDITILMNELKTHGFGVTQTNLLCIGVNID